MDSRNFILNRFNDAVLSEVALSGIKERSGFDDNKPFQAGTSMGSLEYKKVCYINETVGSLPCSEKKTDHCLVGKHLFFGKEWISCALRECMAMFNSNKKLRSVPAIFAGNEHSLEHFCNYVLFISGDDIIVNNIELFNKKFLLENFHSHTTSYDKKIEYLILLSESVEYLTNKMVEVDFSQALKSHKLFVVCKKLGYKKKDVSFEIDATDRLNLRSNTDYDSIIFCYIMIISNDLTRFLAVNLSAELYFKQQLKNRQGLAEFIRNNRGYRRDLEKYHNCNEKLDAQKQEKVNKIVAEKEERQNHSDLCANPRCKKNILESYNYLVDPQDQNALLLKDNIRGSINNKCFGCNAFYLFDNPNLTLNEENVLQICRKLNEKLKPKVEIRKYVCSVCELEFKDLGLLKEHDDLEHNREVPEDEVYMFNSPIEVNKKYIVYHKDEKLYDVYNKFSKSILFEYNEQFDLHVKDYREELATYYYWKKIFLDVLVFVFIFLTLSVLNLGLFKIVPLFVIFSVYLFKYSKRNLRDWLKFLLSFSFLERYSEYQIIFSGYTKEKDYVLVCVNYWFDLVRLLKQNQFDQKFFKEVILLDPITGMYEELDDVKRIEYCCKVKRTGSKVLKEVYTVMEICNYDDENNTPVFQTYSYDKLKYRSRFCKVKKEVFELDEGLLEFNDEQLAVKIKEVHGKLMYDLAINLTNIKDVGNNVNFKISTNNVENAIKKSLGWNTIINKDNLLQNTAGFAVAVFASNRQSHGLSTDF